VKHIALALIVTLAAPAYAGNCGHFFAQQVVVHHKAQAVVAVKQVAIPVYQPAYQVGHSYQSAAEREAIAQRAAEILELRQLRSQIQALKAGVAAPGSPSQPTAANTNSALHQHCGSCHGTDKASPAGGVYIDAGAQIDAETFRKSLEYISGETEPPAKMREVISALKDADKPLLMQELLRAK